MCPRPLVKEGDSSPDVLDAKLRLNLCGANPTLFPVEDFDASTTSATKAFQTQNNLTADGTVGPDTWNLLDKADGGRLDSAADVEQALSTRSQARSQLQQGNFAAAKTMLEPLYERPGLPPEARQPITADLAWAEHGLNNFDRARDLYVQFMLSPIVTALSHRDALQRLREVALGQPPGALESETTGTNLSS
jgi:hypothetical protein